VSGQESGRFEGVGSGWGFDGEWIVLFESEAKGGGGTLRESVIILDLPGIGSVMFRGV
jgi:hypothetical protein